MKALKARLVRLEQRIQAAAPPALESEEAELLRLLERYTVGHHTGVPVPEAVRGENGYLRLLRAFKEGWLAAEIAEAERSRQEAARSKPQ
jgi:hypothetical protein